MSLTACYELTEEEKIAYEERKANKPVYQYEDVNAVITKIDMRHWFATTHRYQWDIEVYYEPYNLSYEESEWANGAMNCPSFLDKDEGETVRVKVKSTYVKTELIGREIIRIY